jgi:protein-S-isoprenylcysteine O-methyltransferase Ste14
MNFRHSLPFGGGFIFLATFWATYVICAGAELYWNVKLQPKDSSGADRGSYRALVVSVNIAFALDFVCAVLLPYGVIVTWKSQLFVAGVLFMWIGVALRWYAIRTLGHDFTVQVRARSSQQVVTRGLYRYIRHPSYAGSLLFAFGIGLALGNWIGLAIVLSVLSVALAYRIAVEEEALASTLGEPYVEYMRKTWRVIPGLV